MNVNELEVHKSTLFLCIHNSFLKKLTLQYFSVVVHAVPPEEIGHGTFTTISSLSCYLYQKVGWVTQSAQRLRAGWFGNRILVGRYFLPVQAGPGAHPASCTMGTGSFPEVKSGRSMLLTTHPLLVPWSPSGPQPGLKWEKFTFFIFIRKGKLRCLTMSPHNLHLICESFLFFNLPCIQHLGCLSRKLNQHKIINFLIEIF